MTSNNIRSRCLAVALAALAGTAFAATADNDGYRQAKAAAKTQYDAANKQCGSLKANAKDICQAEAKLARVKAETEAEVAHKNTPKARAEAREDVAKAEYNLAKERCDDKAGNDKDVCQKEAKASYEKARADAKAQAKTADARADAKETKRDADRKVAEEKCDRLSGDAKSACMDRAKAANPK